jgi:uncharacterized membrane protein
MSWGYNQIFTGRAALLHLGAFTATIMTANVFFQIMPNQRIVVEDLKAGPHAGCEIRQDRQGAFDPQQLPDAAGRLSDAVEPLSAVRSRTEHAWIIASLIFLTGVTDPALLQHHAQDRLWPALDLGRDRAADDRDCLAVDRLRHRTL